MIWAIAMAAALGATPDEALAAGMAAQKAGKTDEAIDRYQACLAADANHVECHWELGWSYWSQNDWPRVVEQWTAVERLDPAHDGLAKYLPTAKAHADALAAMRAAAASAPATVRPPVPAGKTLRIRAVGDIMMGSDFPAPGMFPPYDGAAIFRDVGSVLRDADLTFGNLEGPLCDSGTTEKCAPGENCYAFRTPTRFGDFLVSSGFDVMSIANNHAEDFGLACRISTEDALRARKIAYSGRPGSVAELDVDGVSIAVIAFHTNANSNDVNDLATAQALVKTAKASHDLVFVSFHGGAEGSKATHVAPGKEMFYGENRGDLRVFAHGVIAAGADLVLGHGPHVLRAMEVVDGHLVVYSMGNFATYGRFNLSGPMGISEVLEVTLDSQGRLVAGKILPMKLVDDGIPAPDPENLAIGAVRALSEADFPTTSPIIAQDGTFAPR